MAVSPSPLQSDPEFVPAVEATTTRGRSGRAGRVVHLQRKPFPGQISIELLFANLRDKMREMGQDVTLEVVPYWSKGFWPRLASVIWARRRQGDVSHITGDIHFLAIGLKRERTILTIHDCRALERLSGVKRWMMRKLWFDWPIGKVAVVTAISEETKRQILRYVDVPAEKIMVIPNAVAPVYRPCPKPFRKECPRILHIGTAPNKNLPRLIAALRGVNCRLQVIGTLDVEQRKLLDDSGVPYDVASELDQDAMYRAYCDTDLVSFVSTYEGFGMPIIEAQWVERPVVTSNCSSMPEVAGNGACLVEPTDPNSIRQGIKRVIDDEAYRNSLIEHGRANRQRYSMNEVAAQYLSIYRRLAARAGQG